MADFALGTAELGIVVNTQGLDQGISAAQQKAGDGFTIMGGTIATALGTALASAGGIVLNQVGNIFGAISAGVASNMQFETFEVQFGVLLKSTELAKQRIQELAAFGASTPFDLPGVVEADKILQGFGLHSQESAAKFGFSGTQIRTIAGDVAAGTGQSFTDMALYLGKFSAGATGEAISRFQELGITTREELTGMGVQFSKSGELISPLPEAMTVVLGLMKEKYGGMMAEQSATLEGMLSNFGDWKEGAMRTFAAPIFDVFKNSLGSFLQFTTDHSAQITAALASVGEVIGSVLGSAIDFLTNSLIPGFIAGWQMIAPAVETAMAVLQSVGEVFTGIANEAMGWGENIINQLAGGMMGAAGTVIDILNSIGSMITDLLIPHSPPKLLPGLTAWGMGAINSYMAGWGQGDFSVFNAIGGAIENSIKQINSAAGGKNTNIATIMLGSQAAIAEAINEIHNVGNVSEATFQKIIDAAGPAGPQITGLARAYLELERTTQEVSRAQDELNQVTQQYNEQLAPLQGHLKEIQNKKQAIQDQERLKELQKTVADESIDASKRQIAQLEIEELMAKQQIKSVETERDAVVGAAKAKLDAAKEQQTAAKAQVDQQNALLAVNKKQNDLIAEQTKAMESAGKAMGGAASAMKGTGDAMKPIAETANKVNGALDAAKNTIEGVKNSANELSGSLTMMAGRFAIASTVQSVSSAFATLGATIQSMVQSAMPVLSALITLIGTIMQSIVTAIVQNSGTITTTFTTLWNSVLGVVSTVFGAVMNVVSAVLGVLINLFQTHGTQMMSTVITVWSSISNAVSSIITAIAGFISVVFGQIATWINANQTTIANTIATVWNTIGAIISGVAQIIGTVVSFTFNAMSAFITAHGAQIQAALSAAWNLIVSIITTALNFILGIVNAVLALLSGNWQGAWTIIQQTCANLLLGIRDVIVNALEFIASFFGTSLSGIATTWSGAWEGVKTAASTIWDTIKGVAQGFIDGLIGIIQGAVSGLQGAAQAGLDAILGIWNGFTDWAGIGGDVIDGIIKGISGGIGALKDAVTGAASSALDAAKSFLGISSPSKKFADEVGGPTAEGILQGFMDAFPKVNTNIIKGITLLMESVAKIAADGAKALAILSEFKGTGNQGMISFLDSIEELARRFSATADELGGKILGTANRFSETAGKVAGMVGDAVESLNKLADFIIPTRQSIQAFGDTLAVVVGNIAYVASLFQQKAIDAGAKFAQGASDMLLVIGNAIDAFAQLPSVVAISRDTVARFGNSLIVVIDELIAVTKNWNAQSITSAAAFAESVTSLIGIIGTAVDNFTKLTAFAEVPRQTIVVFANTLWQVVHELALVARLFNAESLDAAKLFSDGVGGILGIIGTAVDNFAKLVDFAEIPRATIAMFANTLWQVVHELAIVARMFNTQSLDAAKIFSDSVSGLIGLIGNAVEGFAKLLDLQEVPRESLTAFGVMLNQIVAIISEIATQFTKESLEAASVFADAAGKVLGIIGTGVDAFAKLKDVARIGVDAVNAFSYNVIIIINQFQQLVKWFNASVQSFDAIIAFADGVAKVLSSLGTAVDGFAKLKDITRVGMDSVNAFSFNIVVIVTQLQSLVKWFDASVHSFDAIIVFANNVSALFSVLGKIVETFAKMEDISRIAIDSVYAFSFNIVIIVTQLQQLVKWFETSVQSFDAMLVFTENAVKVITAVGAVVEAFKKINSTKEIGAAAFNEFVSNISSLMQKIGSVSIDASVNLGVSLMQGIVKGIQSQTSALIKALDDAMGAALEGVKKTLGIASPSRLFEDQVGTNIASGIAKGMDKINDPNFGALLGMTDRFRSSALATAATAPLASNSSATYSDHYTVNATYRHQEESTIRDDLQMVHMLRGKR